MSRKLSFTADDESNDVIKRYEQYLKGKGTGYFDVEELEMIVDYYLRKGRTNESSNALEFGLRLHPASSALKTKRAKIYIVAGDIQKAFRVLDTFGDTSDYEVIMLKIEALSKLGRTKEAFLLGRNLLQQEIDDADNVALDLAYIYIPQLDFETALNFLKLGDKFNDENLDVLFELAFCYEQLAQNDKAIETYHRIIDIDSYMGEAWFNVGQIYFVLQDFDKAIDAYDFVLAINETDSLACLQKAHAHFQLEEYDKAIETYREYEKLTNDHWQVSLFVGESYEKLEQFDEAIVCYRKALDEQPENYDALTGIGICLLEKELYEESMEYFHKAIEIQEDAPDAWVYLAEALTGMDDLSSAVVAYLKSVTIDPNQPETLMAIANIHMDKLDFETALQYYLTAYDLDNTLEHINLFIAVAFYKIKNVEASKVYLKKAVDLNLDAAKLFFEVCPEASKAEML